VNGLRWFELVIAAYDLIDNQSGSVPEPCAGMTGLSSEFRLFAPGRGR